MLKNEQGNKHTKKRRITVTSLCPIRKASSFNRDESFDEAEDDDEEIEDSNRGDKNINGDASLIGMDEESLTELVELSQKIETTL